MNESRSFLINEVDSAVQENLIGLVLSNNNLRLIKDSTIVVRADVKNELVNKGKVCLVSGGGSGHEPSHAGFVGPGLLSASVSGDIFASPNALQIWRAVKFLNSHGKNVETLLLVPNYTGDRLNFGLAKERLAMEGFPTDIFMFGDDCAFKENASRVGRRGLAGIFFVHKCAGAMADRGDRLPVIKRKLEEWSTRIASISVSLSACNIPGKGLSFTIPSGQLEIGLGIHGEAGLRRENKRSVGKVVESMLDILFGEDSQLNSFRRDESNHQTPIVVLFNDNGGLTTMELNIIIKEGLEELEKRRFDTKMVFSGRFVTSFDMTGVCISVMIVNDEILQLMKSSCSTSIVTVNSSISRSPNKSADIFLLDTCTSSHNRKAEESVTLPLALSQHSAKFSQCLKKACESIVDAEKCLNDLDSVEGDSDCGSTLARGANKILEMIHKGEFRSSFEYLAKISEEYMGGTSGAVYSLLFRGACMAIEPNSSFKGHLDEDLKLWAKILGSALDHVGKYSCAKPGDRSLIDPLFDLYHLMQRSTSRKLPEFLHEAYETVKKSVLETSNMEPKVGRAAYSGRCSHNPDAGAYAVSLWFKGICLGLGFEPESGP
ncbi:triokinase/FMN cyclase-like [Brevipalpus obovatus]|uniref:triokinase/FMN cyclase-like n=1 Tax=Brevipalpus obovatus TaxID=246614 RepID=UPI003D9EB036